MCVLNLAVNASNSTMLNDRPAARKSKVFRINMLDVCMTRYDNCITDADLRWVRNAAVSEVRAGAEENASKRAAEAPLFGRIRVSAVRLSLAPIPPDAPGQWD